MSGQLLHAKMKLSGDKPAGTDPIFLTVRCRVQRIVAALNADFTPSRKVELDFSELIFANGGDRSPNKHALPENETQSCVDCNIMTVFGVGSHEVEKRDSSTRINQALGHQQ